MKTVVNSQQVAHLWANQSQEHARNGSSSMSFKGNILLSYSTPIGRIVKGANGEPVALMTPQSYSMTTSSKHKPAMHGAVRHLTRFTVPSFGIGRAGRHSDNGPATMHADNLAYLIAGYESKVARYMRAQQEPYNLREPVVGESLTGDLMSAWLSGPQAYARAFSLAVPKRNTGADSDAIFARFDRLAIMRADPAYIAKRERENGKREERRTAKEKRDREAREAARIEYARKQAEETARIIAEYPGKVAAWRAGTESRFPWSPESVNDAGAFLRIRGDTVETSQGATVPVADAKRAVIFVTAIREKGEAWQRNGATFKVGAFQLDRVSAGGDVNAGCHFIEWDEVARLGAALGMAVQS